MLFSVIYYGKKYLQLHSVLLFDLGVCVVSIESSFWVEWFPMFSRFAPQKQLTFGLSLPFTSHFLFVRVNHEWNHYQPYRTLLLFCFMIDLCQAQAVYPTIVRTKKRTLLDKLVTCVPPFFPKDGAFKKRSLGKLSTYTKDGQGFLRLAFTFGFIVLSFYSAK